MRSVFRRGNSFNTRNQSWLAFASKLNYDVTLRTNIGGKKMGRFKPFVAFFLFVCSAQVALADCDPVKILIQDHYSLTTDNRNALIQNKATDEITTKDQRIDTSYLGYGYATGDERDQFSNAMHEKFNVDYRSSQQRWEAYTQLSDNARQAYADCLKASEDNIFIVPDESVKADATSILLNVQVRNYIPQAKPISMPAHFRYNQEGTPIALPAGDSDLTMFPGSTHAFTLKRDLSKTLTFTAQVGQQTVAFVIPPRVNFQVKREVRFSQNVTTYGHPSDAAHDTHQICIELAGDDDAVIIPGTEQFVALVNRQEGLLHVMLPDGYTPKKVCMKGAQNVNVDGANLTFCGYLTTDVYVKVPQGSSASQYATPPKYYQDYAQHGKSPC